MSLPPELVAAKDESRQRRRSRHRADRSATQRRFAQGDARSVANDRVEAEALADLELAPELDEKGYTTQLLPECCSPREQKRWPARDLQSSPEPPGAELDSLGATTAHAVHCRWSVRSILRVLARLLRSCMHKRGHKHEGAGGAASVVAAARPRSKAAAWEQADGSQLAPPLPMQIGDRARRCASPAIGDGCVRRTARE